MSARMLISVLRNIQNYLTLPRIIICCMYSATFSHLDIHACRNLQSWNVIEVYECPYVSICVTWYLKLSNTASKNYFLYVQRHAEV